MIEQSIRIVKIFNLKIISSNYFKDFPTSVTVNTMKSYRNAENKTLPIPTFLPNQYKLKKNQNSKKSNINEFL